MDQVRPDAGEARGDAGHQLHPCLRRYHRTVCICGGGGQPECAGSRADGGQSGQTDWVGLPVRGAAVR